MKTKRRKDGSTFMEMSSDFLRTSHCFHLLLEPGPNFYPCENNQLLLTPNFEFYMTTSSICFFVTSSMFIFLLALGGVVYPYNRGFFLSVLLAIYTVTSGVAGYTSTKLYLELEGANWVKLFLPSKFYVLVQ